MLITNHVLAGALIGALSPGPVSAFAGKSLAARYASFVKLPHTLFALPFAGVGAVLASYTYPGRVTVVRR